MTRTTLALAGSATAQWELAASPPGDLVDGLLPAGDELYCSSYLGKVYVTTDHAQHWTAVGTLDHATDIVSMILYGLTAWGGRLYAAADGAVVVSDDRGRPVPSGTYLLQLEDGEQVLARKSATLVR